jgi:hypothetical protein
MLRKAYQYRIEGDYEPISEFNNTEVNQLFEDMKEFIFVLERYLNI